MKEELRGQFVRDVLSAVRKISMVGNVDKEVQVMLKFSVESEAGKNIKPPPSRRGLTRQVLNLNTTQFVRDASKPRLDPERDAHSCATRSVGSPLSASSGYAPDPGRAPRCHQRHA